MCGDQFLGDLRFVHLGALFPGLRPFKRHGPVRKEARACGRHQGHERAKKKPGIKPGSSPTGRLKVMRVSSNHPLRDRKYVQLANGSRLISALQHMADMQSANASCK